MFFPRPPKPVVSTKPNVVQVVKQEKTGAVDKHVLIVEKPGTPPPGAPKPK